MTLSPWAMAAALFLKPAVAVGAAAVVVTGFRRRSAATRHATWVVAVVVALAFPLFTVVMPPLRLALPAARDDSPGGGAPRADHRDAIGAAFADPSRVPASPRVDANPWTVNASRAWILDGLMAVWAAGILLLGVRLFTSHVRAHRIARRARTSCEPHIGRLLGETARRAGVRRSIRLGMTHETVSPVIVGVVRPMLLLPVAAEHWPEDELKTALLHELGHVARADCLTRLIGDIASVVYWCNPAVWYAARQLRAESERACDDRVLRSGTDPSAYAQFLLAIARSASLEATPPFAASAMARPTELESRLRAVLDSRVRREPLPWRIGIVVAGAGVAIAVPIAAITLNAAPIARVPVVSADGARSVLASPDSERPVPASLGNATPITAAPLALVREAPTRHQPIEPGDGLDVLAGPDSLLAQRLIAALDHEPTFDGDLVRERAAWALSQAKDGRLVEPLLDALSSSDPLVQEYAAWSLATARDPRATGRLVPLLEHPGWRLRAMAAYALHESRDPRAANAMARALADEAWQVRLECVEYFAAMGGPPVTDLLRPALTDRHIAVRLAAKQALGISHP